MGRKRLVIPAISVTVALAAVAVAVVVTVQRRRIQPASEVITRVVGDQDVAHQVLLPRLQQRTVVVVDRPHNPGDVFKPGGPPRIM